MTGVSSFAQCYDIYYCAALRGGYNVLAHQPTADAYVACDIKNFRTKIELGMGTLPATDDRNVSRFAYVSPSAGVAFGGQNVYYILVGGMPWRKYVSPASNNTFNDVWHFKVESGIEFRLNDWFFWNIETMYMLPGRNHDRECPNLAFKTGVGVNF